MTSRETVLITGAARRIGRAIALDFASRGWRIGVHFNTSQSEAALLVREIVEKGGNAAALQTDLADATAVAGLIPGVRSSAGSPLMPRQ